MQHPVFPGAFPCLLPVVVLLGTLMPTASCRSQFAGYLGQIEGTDHTGAWELSIDPFGNRFLAGYFRGTCDFDPGPAAYPVAGIGVDNIYVARYSPDMELSWVARVGGGTAWDHPRGIATGSMGQVVVAGVFRDSGDFDPGPGVTMLTALDRSDVFIAQLDSTGALDWLVHLPDSSWGQVWDVGLDGNDNVYFTIRTDSTDLDPGPGYSPSIGNALVKYDASGNYLWSIALPDAEQLYVDSSDQVLVAAHLDASYDVDPGPGVIMVDAFDGVALVVEYSPNGTLNGYVQFGQPPPGSFGWGVQVTDMEKDQNGDLVIAGNVYGPSIDLDPGPGQTLVGSSVFSESDWMCMKISSTGNFYWGVSGGSSYVENAMDLSITPSGSVHLCLGYGAAHDVDPGPGTWMVDTHAAPTLVSTDDDGVLLTLSATGQFERAVEIWATGGLELLGTYWSPDGELIAVGNFRDSLTFAPPGTVDLHTSGHTETFVAELDPEFLLHVRESASRELLAFPNPASDAVTIPGLPLDVTLLQVFDAYGRVVPFAPHRSAGSIRSNVSHLRPGAYFLRAIGRDGTVWTTEFLVAGRD